MSKSRIRYFEECLAILGFKMAHKAFRLVKKEMCKEKGYTRHNGDHYYYHLVYVAQKLIGAGIRDENIITAALLHDIVEDVTHIDLVYIRQEFNEPVASMVNLVTKKPDVDYKHNPKELQAYLKAMIKNYGACLIKVSDQIHNISTLLDATPDKRLRKALETETHYIPFFHDCRELYPWYSNFFFDATTIVEPQIQLIKELYYETDKLKKEIVALQSSNNH